MKITNTRLIAAPCPDHESGLLGWVSVTLNDSIVLDGLALRRTARGRLTLSFPNRRDAQGKRHAFIRPLDDRARRDIETQVFRALGLEEVAAP